MPAVSAPFGLIPVRDRAGRPYSGAANAYRVPASDGTALYIGDPVELAGDSDAVLGIPTILRATVGTGVTTDRILGAVVGFEPDDTYRGEKYRRASTSRIVYVADDPTLLFRIQEDAGGGAIASGAVGGTCQILAGTGNTFTGNSGFTLDSSEAAQTATDQLRIWAIEDPGTAYQVVLVTINMHSAAGGLAGI